MTFAPRYLILSIKAVLLSIASIVMLSISVHHAALGQNPEPSDLTLDLTPTQALFAGQWIINSELSDSTDKQVEIALKAAGEKVKRRWFNRSQEIYRGGPPEQELYDHISYDKELTISLEQQTYLFSYESNFQRPVYTDNRSRSVSLTNLDQVEDFSFAHWENNSLLVEARPRDGGFADETYTLLNEGTQLKVSLYIKPRVFQVPIEITRIYNRKTTP